MSRELETATTLARAAADAAMAFYGTATAERKPGGSPVTEADHAANRVIVDGLRDAFPDDAILSEESRDDPSRLDARRVWIVDPLDGTKEFLARNGEFSIMIGLVEAGAPVLGVVYRPDGDVLYRAANGEGAFVERQTADDERELAGERRSANGGRRSADVGPPVAKRLHPSPADMTALRMVASRSHGDALIDAMRDALGVTDVQASGSVGLKCALIAEGSRDLYVHPVPYLREWDTCAPEAILAEAGGTVTDCLGNPLRYNKPDPRQPDGILATAPGVHDRVLEAIEPIYRNQVP